MSISFYLTMKFIVVQFSILLAFVCATHCLSKKNDASLIGRKLATKLATKLARNFRKKTTLFGARQRDEIQNYFAPGNNFGDGNNGFNLNGVTDADDSHGNSFHGDENFFHDTDHHGNGFHGVDDGFHGDAGIGDDQHFDHSEGPHPNVQLEQNIFKAGPHHVFDKASQHIYNEHTRHVTPNHEPLYIVQGKQIEITTKPQHINVHFYQYDKQGKAPFTPCQFLSVR